MEIFRRIFGGKPKEKTSASASPAAGPSQAEASGVKTPIDPPTPVSVEGAPSAPAPSTAQPLQTRPLPPPKEFVSTRKRISYGVLSDVGRVRETNQDAALTILADMDLFNEVPPISMFVVADGMGGHLDGERASAVTAQTLGNYFLTHVMMPHLEGIEPSGDQKTVPEVLEEAMGMANMAVQRDVPNGGTTATATVIRGDLAYIAHVGDSRAYLMTNGQLELVTRDHSLVRRLQELGQLTEEEAEVHPHKNVLYRAIGQGEALEIDAATRRLPPSSSLLLCSDGLWGLMTEERMAEIINESSSPQEACQKLVSEANEAGGPDNITVIIIQMPD
ncbi:MAG: SpoIIE family protein phosphatase [Chloroflexi bacterium]|nr:SpoIIE family protein phosphatase [Chloroflexota bacterium]